MSSDTILVTGASSGFGAMTVRALADAGTPSTPASARPRAATPRPSTTPTVTPPSTLAQAIVEVAGARPGQRPFRVHIDPADDGAEVVNAVGDRIRIEFYRRIGLDDLLAPATP